MFSSMLHSKVYIVTTYLSKTNKVLQLICFCVSTYGNKDKALFLSHYVRVLPFVVTVTVHIRASVHCLWYYVPNAFLTLQ